MIFYSRTILVAVKSECCVKRITCKTWTETLAKSADQDQTPQNAASDQGLQCLLKLQEIRDEIKRSFSGPFSQCIFRDNRPTSAVSALIRCYVQFRKKLNDN